MMNSIRFAEWGAQEDEANPHWVPTVLSTSCLWSQNADSAIVQVKEFTQGRVVEEWPHTKTAIPTSWEQACHLKWKHVFAV